MKQVKKWAVLYLLCMVLTVIGAVCVGVTDSYASSETTQAQETEEETEGTSDTAAKAWAAAITMAVAATGGALAMGFAGRKASESIARQPEAEGPIRTSLMLNMVFIETAIIYALLVVILIIFVL